MKKQLRGTLSLLLATLIWGLAFSAQSVGMDYIGPFTFQTFRCLLAVLGLLPVIALADRTAQDGKTFSSRWQERTLWKAGILCGIPLFLACNLQQVGLVETDAGKSGFLTAMYIVIVPVIGIFRGKKLSAAVPVSVALAVAGLYFLSCMGTDRMSTTDLLTLGCAFAFAAQITFVDIFAPTVDPLRLNAIQCLVCAVLSGIITPFVERPTWDAVAACWLPLAYAGLLSMGAAYSLQIIGQKHMEPAAASLVMSLESVFAVLFGCLLLGEKLTGWEIFGCVLIFIAVLLSQLPDKKKK